MSKFAGESHVLHQPAVSSFGRLGQQILNLLDVGARAAERRELFALDRRELDDCGLTLADVDARLPDLYANDFRVLRRAA